MPYIPYVILPEETCVMIFLPVTQIPGIMACMESCTKGLVQRF